MDRIGHTDVSFFVGTEVEHTPAFGLRTLFVVGLHDPQIVLQEFNNHNCEHIYFGANQSFPPLDINDNFGWRHWEDMIQTCLNNGKKRFNFEIIDEEEGKASSMSPYTITFDITAGGRRSKTRRTKKGKRKGRGRKTRQRK